jgi:predicted N-acetyltransferase YhbS
MKNDAKNDKFTHFSSESKRIQGDISVEIFDRLEINLQIIDKQISDDAFSDLADISDEDKKEMKEKYKINAWKYVMVKLGGDYVGRVVLDKRNISSTDFSAVGVGVGGLAVKSQFQGQGIGSKIMQSVIDLCKSAGIDFIFLNAEEELHNFYKTFGFRIKSYKFNGISGKEYLENDGMILIFNEQKRSLIEDNVFSIGVGNV